VIEILFLVIGKTIIGRLMPEFDNSFEWIEATTFFLCLKVLVDLRVSILVWVTWFFSQHFLVNVGFARPLKAHDSE